jgi:hypothetical protein
VNDLFHAVPLLVRWNRVPVPQLSPLSVPMGLQHTLDWQKYPPAQCPSFVQSLRQLIPSHMYGEQSTSPPFRQLPPPSHVSSLCWINPEQCCASHTSPAAWYSHDPPPPHTPVNPQLESGSVAHSFSGSIP